MFLCREMIFLQKFSNNFLITFSIILILSSYSLSSFFSLSLLFLINQMKENQNCDRSYTKELYIYHYSSLYCFILSIQNFAYEKTKYIIDTTLKAPTQLYKRWVCPFMRKIKDYKKICLTYFFLFLNCILQNILSLKIIES